MVGDAGMPSQAMQDVIDGFWIGGGPVPARFRPRWKSAAPRSPPPGGFTWCLMTCWCGR